MTLVHADDLGSHLWAPHVHDTLRFETRDHYHVPSDGDDFARWLDGAPDPTPEVGYAWRQRLRERAAAGRPVRRVRVLHGEPSEYLRFEMAWAYTRNVEAGERIRVIDSRKWGGILAATPEDFWLIDHTVGLVMHYLSDGSFAGAEHVTGHDTRPLAISAHVAWTHGTDFTAWWDAHPQYHRSAGVRAAT